MNWRVIAAQPLRDRPLARIAIAVATRVPETQFPRAVPARCPSVSLDPRARGNKLTRPDPVAPDLLESTRLTRDVNLEPLGSRALGPASRFLSGRFHGGARQNTRPRRRNSCILLLGGGARNVRRTAWAGWRQGSYAIARDGLITMGFLAGGRFSERSRGYLRCSEPFRDRGPGLLQRYLRISSHC